ncbi:hypothetical protein, variant [Exophiala oligosperma]|uniref:Peptidase M48 domain-containing protein n=1 Tax=Exophiala oligosperma TaxID=215243 RepID=A0A0D2DLH5_9EURO|nr:uncharacterized protein PV06_04403 [Exophiala oligosperma]XP_016263501.1 hypothetical protein, variant [Exophiala oligosperma]KIW43284.1 hypothetical protein PV06_04403 [Exophiala oligosperma]KIW43285.1 hypothetical protein, variant [Exophiala oligosperma]
MDYWMLPIVLIRLSRCASAALLSLTNTTWVKYLSNEVVGNESGPRYDLSSFVLLETLVHEEVVHIKKNPHTLHTYCDWKRSCMAWRLALVRFPRRETLLSYSMGSLPPFLVAEVRLAFSTCSRRYAATKHARFSTSRPLYQKFKPLPVEKKKQKKNERVPIQVVYARQQAQQQLEGTRTALPQQSEASTELVVPQQEDWALDGGRKVEVPLKVIPKAEITPNLTLSPEERLHIEQLTRRPPAPVEPKVHKKRLRIYSAGRGRIYMMTLLRYASIIGLLFLTVIVAPAHWVNGSSALMVAGLWLAGAFPFVFISWICRPW